MAESIRRPPGVPAVIPSVFPGMIPYQTSHIPLVFTIDSRIEIPPSIVHPSKDLFTALDLQPLYARFVKAPVNPGTYPRTFVSDVKDESRRGSNIADGSAPGTPGGKDVSFADEKDGMRSPGGAGNQLMQQKGQAGNQKKPPKPKLFSSVYEELLQEIPGEYSR